MEEELISLETAKLAKEKGFNYLCIGYYTFDDTEEEWIVCAENSPSFINNRNNHVAAPTQSLLQKWLREKYNINIYCTPCEHDELLWYNNIASHNPVFTGTYEEVLELGLLEALKLI